MDGQLKVSVMHHELHAPSVSLRRSGPLQAVPRVTPFPASWIPLTRILSRGYAGRSMGGASVEKWGGFLCIVPPLLLKHIDPLH